jgi:hypothetical protein
MRMSWPPSDQEALLLDTLEALFDVQRGVHGKPEAMWYAFRNMHNYIDWTETGQDQVRVSPCAVNMLAVHMEDGIKAGYDERNWEKGIPLGRFLESAIRHTLQVLNGDNDENHKAAAFWNMHGFLHTWYAIERGELPQSLNNLRTSAKEEKSAEGQDEAE